MAENTENTKSLMTKIWLIFVEICALWLARLGGFPLKSPRVYDQAVSNSLFKKNLLGSITTMDSDDDRICGISVMFPDGRILKLIIMVYMPSSNYYSNYIEKPYDTIYQSQLNEECECIIKWEILFVS